MARVLMYSTRLCPFCRLADQLLKQKGVEADHILVDTQPERRAEMTRLTGRTSVPQIFINGRHVGGYQELTELNRRGELDDMLRAEPTAGAGDEPGSSTEDRKNEP
jgi:glutaredoxin 3